MTSFGKTIIAIAIVGIVVPVLASLWHLRGDATQVPITPIAAMILSTQQPKLVSLETSPATTQASAQAYTTWNDVFDRIIAMYRVKPPVDASSETLISSLADAIAKNLALRHELIHRLQLGSDEVEKAVIKSLLTKQVTPEVEALSRELVNSNDATQRRDGYELLLNLPPDTERYKAVAQALERENDRDVLIAVAVAASLVRETQVQALPSEAMVEQFRVLTQHVDPTVRRLSLRALSQWDQSAHIDADLQRGLMDAQDEVRLAAVSSIGTNPQRIESLKSRLIAIAHGTSETPETRNAALGALSSLPHIGDDAALPDAAGGEFDMRQ